MRRYLTITLICLASCLSHQAENIAKAESPIGPPANVLNGNSKVDDVLDALQKSGKDVKSFSSDVTDTEDDQVQGTEVIRYGKVWFQTLPNGDHTLHLILDRKQVGKKLIPEKIEYLLDGGWVTIRNYDKKNETRIQLVPAGQKLDLFQLGKGPFPLPIGQDKKDVHSQFDVTIQPLDKDDPKETIHLMLIPKPANPLSDNFFSIEVWVDPSTNMPVQIMTENKQKVQLKTWNLLNLKINPALNANDLTLPALEKGWDSVEKPLDNK
jgi:outer membrane lipoprotein-sorting protein